MSIRADILFMGTPEFAVPALKALADAGHNIVKVVTQPDRPKGRGRKTADGAVKREALELGLTVWQPENLKDPEVKRELLSIDADILVVVAYGLYMPGWLIELPKICSINAHGSLLPAYRGAAPIQWAIVHGETETGVTIQKVVSKMDAGDIILRMKTPIGDEDNAQTVYDRLMAMSAEGLVEGVRQLLTGEVVFTKQDESKVTWARIIRKEDGKVDWSRPAREIHNLVRGFYPWPAAFTTLDGQHLKILKTRVVKEDSRFAPGTVEESCTEHGLLVACGEHVLQIQTCQLQNRKAMNVCDFLCGCQVEVGTVLGT